MRIVRVTHHGNRVLFGGVGRENVSSKHPGAVHYLSLHDNKLIRNFYANGVAASATVTGISMSPVDDSFLSSSSDGTVR